MSDAKKALLPTVRDRAKTAIPTLVSRRIDLPCVVAGFAPPPPCNVHLKFLSSRGGWTLLVLTDPGLPTKVAKWLLPFGPKSVHIAPGLAPKVLRATFERLPQAWETMLENVIVHYVQLTAEGSASIFVEDSLEKVERFVAGLRHGSEGIRERKTQSSSARVTLTARQLEVLALAVALGYYESPHKVTLRMLAKKLGLSVGAVSELLRRGEALIITNYVDTFSASSWKGSEDPE